MRSPANITTLLLAVATLAAGCGTRPPPGLTASVPNVTGVCQHTCTPDPGSPLVDCRLAEGHLEFAQPYIWDFNGDTATSMYSYTDNTTQIQTFGVNGKRQTWQPPTRAMERCSNPANPMNKVIHIQGGPFLGWGGGVGIAMANHLGGFPTSPGPPEISGAAIDVSAWEGVSFWARRGPDSQGGIRVLVGDKNTDDDISYRMYHTDPSTTRFCERVRECACQNHMACTEITVATVNGKVVTPAPDAGAPDAGYPPECIPAHAAITMSAQMSYCGAPQVLSGGALGSSGATQCNTCQDTRCDEPYPAYPDDTATPGTGDGGVTAPDGGTAPLGTDRAFWGKHCTPFQYRNGVSSSFCYDPATEKPAEPNEQCGDHWTTPVNLTNEWRLYLVPFTSMTQQGWAKKFAALDLTAVSVVRFTWDGGWIDYYLDDVTFYRYKRDAATPEDPGVTARMPDDDGYRLWLRYEPIADATRRDEARAAFVRVAMPAPTPTLAVARDELARGLAGLLGADVRFADGEGDATAILGTRLNTLPAEGFAIEQATLDGRTVVTLAAGGEAGILYGVFHLLRHLQAGRPLAALPTRQAPPVALRMLDHWDNLDGTIERGYAGRSLWDWAALPGEVAPRLRDYARANASIGINAVALNNVNADARILTAEYLAKVAAVAGVLRPYGIRVFLSARFSAPIELGGLATADPLHAAVAAWWRDKADEIYRAVPDFGGFLVKANSEGQPGPQDYGRSHADGANVLADALAPHGGTVVWRAFVYRADIAEDRAKQAYRELVPLDGRFRTNVLVQVKNGPIDFQPREPFHPLFGAMPGTPLVLELQLAQEYLGFATHLAYLAPMFEEVLRADTHAEGPGSTVARVVDGTLHGQTRTGIAAVANTGDARNWCGHPFAQSNWYAFGRLAWDPALGARELADEWLRLTFTSDARFVAPVTAMMLASGEAVVDYMTPLGLHHLMAKDHHYGPGPWVDEGRPDWTSVYYHRADAEGIGFDRTASGSDALSLYRSPLREEWGDPAHCPEPLLLWFHHVAWDRPMRSGRTLWDELCHHYTAGVDAVRAMQRTWDSVAGLVDTARAEQVRALLAVQEQEARWWRNACLLYFQTFSKRPLPAGLPPLEGTLAEYRAFRARDVPGL